MPSDKTITIKAIPIECNHGDGIFEIFPTVVETSNGFVVVDTGYPNEGQKLLDQLSKHGLDLTKFRALVLTHHDYDHMGCAAELKRILPYIKIYCSPEERPYIQGDEKSIRILQSEAIFDTLSEEQQKDALVFEEILDKVEGVVIDATITEGNTIPEFEEITVIPTPGHLPGHISLYIEPLKSIITGDAMIFAKGKLSIANPQYAWNFDKAKLSYEKLLQLPFERVYCFHGGVFDATDAKKSFSIHKILPFEIPFLYRIWEESVSNTHHFLSKEHFELIGSIIKKSSFEGMIMFGAKDFRGKIIGFAGVSNNKLEALFILSDYIGKGAGSMLLDYVVSKMEITQVDVNEKNSNALDFYLKKGFIVKGRSETDSLGLPYPILHLTISK
jgi:glyoxylase-like metal-dependent hydrolase (beta-lactamase superfamily II)